MAQLPVPEFVDASTARCPLQRRFVHVRRLRHVERRCSPAEQVDTATLRPGSRPGRSLPRRARSDVDPRRRHPEPSAGRAALTAPPSAPCQRQLFPTPCSFASLGGFHPTVSGRSAPGFRSIAEIGYPLQNWRFGFILVEQPKAQPSKRRRTVPGNRHETFLDSRVYQRQVFVFPALDWPVVLGDIHPARLSAAQLRVQPAVLVQHPVSQPANHDIVGLDVGEPRLLCRQQLPDADDIIKYLDVLAREPSCTRRS